MGEAKLIRVKVTNEDLEYIDELILDGVVCGSCGTAIDGYATGYPRTCENCKEDE